jgi:hypothetical protein
MAATTNNGTRLRKAVEALLTNPPQDNDPWRTAAPATAGWHLSGDLWKKGVCAQTHTATVRKALRAQDLIEEKRVTKPSTRRGRRDATTTAIRLKNGHGCRHVLHWLLKDYYLYVKYYREFRAPYFQRNREHLDQLKQEWTQLIQPIEQLLAPTRPDGRASHRDVLFAEFFEFFLAHQKTATTLLQQLPTILREVCTDAPTGMRHRCRTDFLIRILYSDNLLKQATTTNEQEIHTLLKNEANAFNKCLKHHKHQEEQARANDVWG